PSSSLLPSSSSEPLVRLKMVLRRKGLSPSLSWLGLVRPAGRAAWSSNRLPENGRDEPEEVDSCSSSSSSSSRFLRKKLIFGSYHNLTICATHLTQNKIASYWILSLALQ